MTLMSGNYCASGSTNLDVVKSFECPVISVNINSPHHTASASARLGEASERARVVHRPPLTGFTSGVHEVHLLSRLRSSSIPGTELSH
jgi:hypothetical protein